MIHATSALTPKDDHITWAWTAAIFGATVLIAWLFSNAKAASEIESEDARRDLLLYNAAIAWAERKSADTTWADHRHTGPVRLDKCPACREELGLARLAAALHDERPESDSGFSFTCPVCEDSATYWDFAADAPAICRGCSDLIAAEMDRELGRGAA